ncbi:MAG: type II toxin-antitoxin system PemK/MazF family toxin [Nocardioidaceae bacterium]
MKRGDIYWAAPDPSVGHEQAGRRPVLIVSSNDTLAAIPHLLTAVPLTTRERPWATRVPVTGKSTGLTQPTWAICEQVRTISTERLGSQLGVADTATVDKIGHVLRYLLDL